MTVFEAGETYPTRGGSEFYVSEVFDGRLFGRERNSDGTWKASGRGGNGKFYTSGAESFLDLIPPDPPIPPVVVSDALVDRTEQAFAFESGGFPATRAWWRVAIREAITAWLHEHPHALAGYRRDCAEREGGQ